MQHRLALKHLSGSRANKVDNFALPPEREIIFGRDTGCHVRYDEADELVSRRHLKIVATDEQPVRYMVVDLGSRNGTFVNRQKVFGAVLLQPGGRVQLGADGPEFEFQLDTREAHGTLSCAKSSANTDGRNSKIRGAGSARKRRFARGVLMMFLLAAAGATSYAAWAVWPTAWPAVWSRVAPLWRDWHSARAGRESKARFSAPAAYASVASVEAEWNVFDKQTGARLARAYIANERISQSARVPLVEGAPGALPVFVLGADRQIEPLLVPAETAHAGRAVGGKWTSKGVIVSETGAVLTAAPSEHPWNTPHNWTANEPAGVLLVMEAMKITQVVPLAASQFPRWAPAKSGFFAEELPADLQGDIRGRWVSGSDLRVGVSVDIAASGRILKAKLAAESSGIWLASVQPGIAFAGIRVPLLDDGATRPKNGQPVWVVADETEKDQIRDISAEGLIELRASGCDEGGIVFDQDGRVLALCIPDTYSKTGSGVAVPIRRGLALLGATYGKPFQP